MQYDVKAKKPVLEIIALENEVNGEVTIPLVCQLGSVVMECYTVICFKIDIV